MKLTLKYKVIGLALIAASLPVAVMSTLTFLEKQDIRATVDNEVRTLIDENTEQIVKDVYAMCDSTNSMIQEEVENKLCLARVLLDRDGGWKTSPQKIRWNVENQHTRAQAMVDLPKVMLAGQWLGQNADAQVRTPLVDDVRDLTGCACTLFQRVNKQGDMLRIATNVLDGQGKRAVGACLPARNANQQINPAIAAVLGGQSYRGQAGVVDGGYLTACEPIMDNQGNVAGMLCVGIRQEDCLASLREAIRNIKVGKTGYVFALGGKGAMRGRYIIAKQDSQCDNRDILKVRDPIDGRMVAEEMVRKATAAVPGDVSHEDYHWLLPGEAAPRRKFAAFTYFEPWDWVIGAGTYLDDYNDIRQAVDASLDQLLFCSLGTGAVLLVVMSGLALLFGGRIADPITRITSVAQTIADGDLHTAARAIRPMIDVHCSAANGEAAAEHSCDGDDETERLLLAVDSMTRSLSSLVGQVQYSGIQVTTSATEIAASAKELEATAAEQAASSAEVVSSARQISATAKELADTMDEMTATASETSTVAAGGQRQLAGMEETMRQLADATCAISARLSAINEKTDNISNIVTTINKVADQTNLLSLNAAIEAEKAGEYGRGFSVVAREIRRLADQAAVATNEIEEMVKEMQDAVSAGVMEMDKFNAQVRHGVDDMVQLSGRQTQIIGQVQALLGRFEKLNEGMRQQSDSAQQISESMAQLGEATQQTAVSLREFNKVTEQLNAASHGLQSEVARFRVNA